MEESTFDFTFTHIRRQKKAVTDEEWIKQFLTRAPVAVLATATQNQPFLSTKQFVYDEQRHIIYLHSADQGRTPNNLRANPKVCLTAFEMGRFIPARKACNFSVEYASVVIFGTASLVEDEQEMIEALKQIMQKYAPQFTPGVDYPTIAPSDLAGVAVIRVAILGWSGKRASEPLDHPEAYNYLPPGDYEAS
jgi:hypothetical protein